MAFLPLPVRMRAELKRPLGRLIPDAAVSRAEVLRGTADGAAVITVGDATTDRVRGLGIRTALEIVDGLEGRVRRRGRSRNRQQAEGGGSDAAGAAAAPGAVRIVECENRPGGICLECAGLVRECLAPPLLRPARMLVRGEEDMLVVPACLYAPDGAAVMYGQPGRGIVVVAAGPAARDRAKSVLERMAAGHDETVAV